MSWNITTFILYSKRCKFLFGYYHCVFFKILCKTIGTAILFLLFFIKLTALMSNRELMGFGK